ncbi:MAG: hypothetical protein N3A66_01930 [Planctomycetota bacterium]|nr:hypothetical protein [Planctomycetota bacterium]
MKSRRTLRALIARDAWIHRYLRRDAEAVRLADSGGGIRMSEALLALLEPILAEEKQPDENAWHANLGLACLAWNLALLQERDRERELMTVLQDLAGDDVLDRAILRKEIMDLVRRKLELFPEIERLIVDFRFRGEKDAFEVEVLSTPLRRGHGKVDISLRPLDRNTQVV